MSEHSHLMDENVVQSQINFKYKTKLNGISEPCEFYCFTCNQPRISRIEYSYSKATFIWCCILCFCTIILGLVPFCMQKCSSKTHYCPICDKIVGYTDGELC
ncbi:unnamed protein product [Paramecium pentaurelia]|uniref:LITAF domain-containing protein n=1 Tax=Paramecium pentaurelia TaxID=43138 RepID=A0A8S1WXR1_9CILI|nr:unnamed protein product [Paramecium pentaurelia]